MDLEEEILLIQIKRAEERIRKLQSLSSDEPVRRQIDESEYLTQTPVNLGPDYLTVQGSVWGKPKVDGKEIKNLAEARQIASLRGLKGISILFGRDS